MQLSAEAERYSAERRKAERRLRRLTRRRRFRPHRRRRSRETRSWARWWLTVPLLILLAGVLAVLGWRDLSAARTDVLRARARLVGVASAPTRMETPKGRAAAVRAVTRAEEHLTRAQSRVDRSIGLRVVGTLPALRDQRRAAETLLDNAIAATRAGRELLTRLDGLVAGLEVRDGAVPLEALSELEAVVRTAHGRLAALPPVPGKPWPMLADATTEFETTVADTKERLADAADATGAARAFLGGDGRRRYFLAAQNNAEMRDSGMVLSYAVVEIEHGRMRVIRQGTTIDLALRTPAPIPVPEGTQTIFGPIGIVQAWQSVNATADFGFSGKAMLAMYRHATGEQLDGVIAVDVPALANVLRVIGPVNVAGLPRPLTAKNAPKVLLNELYEALPARANQGERKEILDKVMAATIDRISAGGYEPLRLVRLLGESARGLHFRLHSADPRVERVFEQSGLGGGPASTAADRTIHFAVQNFTATKLDYFVKPRADVDVAVDADGTARLTTTITIQNEAPTGAAPSYQFGPDGVNTTSPGQYVTQVYFWGPKGALQRGGVPESGLVVNYDPQEVFPGEARQVVFRTTVPAAVRAGRLDLRFVPQPRLFPVPISVRLNAPDWVIDGRATYALSGRVTETASWRLSRR